MLGTRNDQLSRLLAKEFGKQLRVMRRGAQRQPCEVCGRHLEISELHHVLEVSELVKQMQRLLRNAGDQALGTHLLTPTAWLCPNHHTMLHYKGPLECLDIGDLAELQALQKLQETGRQAQLRNSQIISRTLDALN